MPNAISIKQFLPNFLVFSSFCEKYIIPSVKPMDGLKKQITYAKNLKGPCGIKKNAGFSTGIIVVLARQLSQ